MNESEVNFLKRSCGGIVRCLSSTEHLSTISTFTNTGMPEKWDVLSDNVVAVDDTHVFKIFDNRFYPTYPKPDHWLTTHPWIADLNVEKYLEFQESDTIDCLGKPKNARKQPLEEESPNIVSYPKGSVVVIKYQFVKGTHFASKVSDFQAIAACINLMHAANIAHSDIRGFNMLHPHPEMPDGIQTSRLIDFDLCGEPGVDKYPPGFSENVRDNLFLRCGIPGKEIEMSDDWQELASVMAHYSISNKETIEALKTLCLTFREPTTEGPVKYAELMKNFIEEHGDFSISNKQAVEAWETLCLTFREPTTEGHVNFAELINNFIEEHGDCQIAIPNLMKHELEAMLKGIGTSNKKQQKSRGSVLTS